ncbi:site-specific integrase [Salipaludibacillus keqinensis]|uniref:site-specific integrase n=1 Tax=Salipaludibacillus keqinensis TaxID=2045207 RepID=UPI000DA17A95|nr:site-specific integrase [Salipaludibacillus keqinensis]
MDCDLRNLRPYTIKYYPNELSAFLAHLSKQGIDIDHLKTIHVTEEYNRKSQFLKDRKQRLLFAFLI